MKKMSLFLAIMMMVTVLGTALSEEPTTVEAWLVQTADDSVLAQLQEEFNATHDDVKVNITVMSWSTVREKIIAGLGLPPIFVPTCELVKTVRWHPHSFLGLATS